MSDSERAPAMGAEPAFVALPSELEAILEVTPSSVRVFDAAGTLTRLNAAARAEHPDDARRPWTLHALWESDQPLRPAPNGAEARAAGRGVAGRGTGGSGASVSVAFVDHPATRAMRGESVRCETYVVRRGRAGERRVIDTYAGPVLDPAGRIVGAVLVERDTTERARLARALEAQVRRTMELNERVLNEAATLEKMVEARSRELLALQESRSRERRLAAVGQLAAGVMHDVNNALNPIMSAAFLLERRADDPAAVRDYAQRIAKAAETCAASAARVGRFIRQEPPAEGRDEAVDLAVLGDEVLAMSRAAWTDGMEGAHIEIHGQLAPGTTARGIPGEIREALLNLVKNAIDAMPGGGRLTLAAAVAGEGDGAESWIAVGDTGHGMSEDVRDRAFEPFFSTKGAGGSGLGLAEVYGIMKRHRGRAEIDSAPGRGTTVRLVFPFAAPGEPPRPAPTPPPTVSRRVLIVEDHVEGREFVRALLASDGHVVDAVADLREARALLDVRDVRGEGRRGRAGAGSRTLPMPFDVLITDVGLPDGNGWELVHAARARWPGLRIAVVTGWEPQMTGEITGADVTLRKPLRADELLDFVAHHAKAQGR